MIYYGALRAEKEILNMHQIHTRIFVRGQYIGAFFVWYEIRKEKKNYSILTHTLVCTCIITEVLGCKLKWSRNLFTCFGYKDPRTECR